MSSYRTGIRAIIKFYNELEMTPTQTYMVKTKTSTKLWLLNGIGVAVTDGGIEHHKSEEEKG